MDALNTLFGETPERGWITSRHRNGRLYVELKDISSFTEDTGRDLVQLVQEERKPLEDVVINFESVRTINGKGLAALLYLSKKMEENRRRLYLVQVNYAIRKILAVTEIDQLIHVQESDARLTEPVQDLGGNGSPLSLSEDHT